MTLMKQFGDFQKDTPEERNLRFGVREHAMGAICNGIALYSPGFIPYCATFFIFTGALPSRRQLSPITCNRFAAMVRMLICASISCNFRLLP